MIYHMTRGLKYAAYALAVLFVLAAGLVLYLKSLDFNDYKPQIQEAVQQATGRALIIDGRMNLSIFSMHPTLVLDGVHLANMQGGSRPNMLDVERLELELSLWPLLSGELYVERLVLLRPDILLERLADGSANWIFDQIASGAALDSLVSESVTLDASAPLSLPLVHHVLISQAMVSYRDAMNGQTESLSIPELEVWQKGEGLDEPLHLLVSGEYRSFPLKIQGTLGSVRLLAANQPLDIALNIAMAGAELQMAGSVARPLDGSGMVLGVELSAPGLGGLAKLVGMPVALDLPLHVKTALKDNDDGFELHGMQASLGANDLAGDVLLGLSKARPVISATLQSGRFSLNELLPEGKADAVQGGSGKTGGQTEQPKRVLPAEPLDVQSLRLVDVDIAYKAKLFVVSGMQLTDMDVKLRLSGGVLSISPFKARLGGGTINSTISLRGDRLPATFDLAVTGRNIIAAQLVEQGSKKGEKPMMEGGSTNIDINLKGTGKSIAEIMGHSNGRIKLSLGKAKVKSDALNLVGGDVVMGLVDKLNPFAESKDYTAVQCGVVHFRVQDGLMVSEDGIAIETDRMNILSEGEINLQDETLDLSVGTEPREGIGVNVSNMVNVVRLGGTLAEPGIRMDVAKSGKAVARVAGAVMTGGLSLLGEGLFNRVTADSSPCKTALEMK